MKLVSPAKVLTQVASAIPEECRQHVIVIGSLAAGYQFFGDNDEQAVRTKDVDCVIAPRIVAISSGENTAQTLLDNGWRRRAAGGWDRPGTEETPDDKLSAVRLYPPNSDEWFLEFLTVPESENDKGKNWTRIKLTDGYYALPSFRFLSLTTFEPFDIPKLGIRYARPEMMALANLLEHPLIKDDPMSSEIEGRVIKRSNKDLGRILAIARLSAEGVTETWVDRWARALKQEFPTQWREIAANAGSGMRALLASPNDLEEAHYACINGLLASVGNVTIEQLRIVAEQVLVDAIEPLEKLAKV
jgi:hypothetical protein